MNRRSEYSAPDGAPEGGFKGVISTKIPPLTGLWKHTRSTTLNGTYHNRGWPRQFDKAGIWNNVLALVLVGQEEAPMQFLVES